MLKRGGLSLARFVEAIPPELLDEYVGRLARSAPPDSKLPRGWEVLNAEALSLYLSAPENAEVAGIIREDFRRVNDIARDGAGVLVRACDKYKIHLNGYAPEAMAMQLFLNHGQAFEFAWSRYLLYGSTARLSAHPLPLGDLTVMPDQAVKFEAGVRVWYANQAKGEQCMVKCFEDTGQTVVLVQHGTYVQTVSFWDRDEVRLTSFRPALEDVLLYDPETQVLRIKAGLAKDRDEYVRLFALCIGGDERLADEALSGEVFSLSPVEQDEFDFSGDGPITKVELRRVTMTVYGATNLIADFRSPDILKSFGRDLPGFGISSGLLTLARFRFYIHYPGEKPTTVTFSIEPPSTTDLAERRYTDLILNYLRRQGIKLQ
jgi:hypothetical protein